MTIAPEEPPAPVSPPSGNNTPLWISLAAVGGLLVGIVGTLGVVAVTSSIGAAVAAAESVAEAEAESRANFVGPMDSDAVADQPVTVGQIPTVDFATEFA